MMQGFKRTRLTDVAFIISTLIILKFTSVKMLNDEANRRSLKAKSAHFLAPDSLGGTPTTVAQMSNHLQIDDPDADCPFRHSPLYRSVFVYPSPREALFRAMKSDRAKTSSNGTVPMWPWLSMNEEFRKKKFLLYNIHQDDMNHFAV